MLVRRRACRNGEKRNLNATRKDQFPQALGSHSANRYSASYEKKAAQTVTTQLDAITSEAGERYALALYDLAEEANILPAVEADIETLGEALGVSDDLRRAILSPVYKAVEKAAALKALAEKLKLNELTTRFVGVVAANGRAGDLPVMLRAFKALAARRRGAVTADVATADALTQGQLKELQTALKTALGKDVEIRTEVREDLIGGLILKIGSRMFDSSLKSKLEGLRKTMKEA